MGKGAFWHMGDFIEWAWALFAPSAKVIHRRLAQAVVYSQAKTLMVFVTVYGKTRHVGGRAQ